jgi:nitrogen PTS system EIIA component
LLTGDVALVPSGCFSLCRSIHSNVEISAAGDIWSPFPSDAHRQSSSRALFSFKQRAGMSHMWINLDELALQLGRDRRELEKLANRGRIPGRKVSGDWQFHPVEITHWLEQEMREYNDDELANVEQSQRSSEVDAGIPVSSLLHPETVAVPLSGRTKRSILEELVEVAGRTYQIWQPALVLQAVRDREDVLSTAFENGVALPHPRNPLPDALGESVIAYGRTLSGIAFGAPKRQLTDLFFLVLCRDSKTHLQVLARLGRLVQQPTFLETLREADDSQAAYQAICAADEQIGSD